MYPKLKTSLICAITQEEIAKLSAFIAKTAKEHGLRAVACSEKDDLTKYGIERSSCIDRKRIENIIGCPLDDSSATTARRHALHNPESEILIGSVLDGEKITDRKVKSNKQGQMKLF